MEVKQLTETLYVSGQIRPEQLPQLGELGFSQLICLRPDDEQPGQPDFQQIAEAAQSEQVNCVHIPVTMNHITEQQVRAMSQALATEKMTLAYCGSGMRACLLWALCAVAAGQPVEEVINTARHAGYDLTQALANLS